MVVPTRMFVLPIFTAVSQSPDMPMLSSREPSSGCRVLLQEISTQIVQLLEIGFGRRVQLPDRHKSHQMKLRAAAQNELCQRKALFREATTLPSCEA